jgi:Flp pilus assembly protein protease CpaA
MKISNWFIAGLILIFFALSYQTFQDAQPEYRSKRIYD